jgi:hypothetical protein
MASMRFVQEIRCDTATFWQLFFDSELNELLYRKGLEFRDFAVKSFDESATHIRRSIDVMPNMKGVPGPVAKLLGGNFRYVEEGSYDKQSGVYRFSMKPNTLADRLRQEGTVTAPVNEHGHVDRTVDMLVEAKIFGIGGLVESVAEKIFRDAWQSSAGFMNDWIDGRRPS